MKTKLKSITIIIFLLVILVSIIVFPSTTSSSVLLGINIWVYNVFPSLFPFFILSYLLINYGFNAFLGELTKNIMRIFGLSGNTSFAFFGSMISGFPSGAKYIKELLDNKSISLNDANKLIMFTHFSNPLFILGMIGTIILNNYKLGLIILISHYLGNFIIGVLFRKNKSIKKEKTSLKKAIKEMNDVRIKKTDTFMETLSKAIENTLKTLFNMLGIIIIFSVISSIVENIFNLGDTTSLIIKCLLEMTQGIKATSEFNTSILTKVLLITGTISFGGISVHTQVSSILANTKVKYSNFLIARIFHVFISCFIAYLMYMIFTQI